MSRILSVASGKGGTGKTSISVNLSLALGRMGRTVCLLDADLGLSNVDVLLGISPKLTLEDVLFEGVPMEAAILRAGPGLDVIPGGSGVSRLADLSRDARATLATEFAKLEGYDYLIVDGSPGISSQVISLCLACPELLVVVNPDPASLTDAYALVKVLFENGLRRSPNVVVNRAASGESARNIFGRLRGAMGKYLKLDANLLGHIPNDPHVGAAAGRQRPLVELYPASNAGRAMLALARSLDEAKLSAGTVASSPAAFMEGALVRMRESSPMRGQDRTNPEIGKALDKALALVRLLESPEQGGTPPEPGTEQKFVLARLKALLQAARREAGPPGEAPPKEQPVRVAVISSDDAIRDILTESLGSSGLSVSQTGNGNGNGKSKGHAGAGADAAVVFWHGEPKALARRLAELGSVNYVLVRSVASKEIPRLGRSPAEVMDMPFRLEALAHAVRRCARKSVSAGQ